MIHITTIARYGRFSTVHVLYYIPDPGAFSACMRTFPESKIWIYSGLMHTSMYLDMGFKTLDVKVGELKLREVTVPNSYIYIYIYIYMYV